MRSVVKAASLGLAAGQGARELFAPVAPGQVYNQYPTQYVQYDAAPQYAYEQPVSINVFFPGRFGGGLEITPTLEGSFSAISKPMFTMKRSSCRNFHFHFSSCFAESSTDAVFFPRGSLFRRNVNILFPELQDITNDYRMSVIFPDVTDILEKCPEIIKKI